MRSKTVFTTSLSEVENQLKEIIQFEFRPTLAIAFASLDVDIQALSAICQRYDIQLIGATTAGEIADSSIQSGGVSMVLLDMKEAYFSIVQKEANYDNSVRVGREIAASAKKSFDNPAFIMVFSLNISGEQLIEGISKEMDNAPIIFGGMAGDDMKMEASFTFTDQNIGDNLVTTLIVDNDKIAVDGLAICGWQPIGLENTITKAKNNIIYQINDEPALNVVKSYFGNYFANTVDEESVPLGAAQYPLQIVREGNYILRAAMSANEEDGSLMMAGPVEQGDRFRFSVAPGFELIDQTVEGFRTYHQTYPEADVLIMFACVARHMSLGPLIEDEIGGIHQIWKKPLVGFFTYGEVGQQGTGTSYFYNETCCLVLLREK